ncbi:MAG: hypothetical protein FJ267_13950, partial [Planctomycetes bacterium]|nr:hypothetical protein [Planctomycetota bacterium]
MQPGSVYSMQQKSELSDAQLMLKSRRLTYNRFSFGLGYRHISFNESSSVAVTGIFDAFDIDGDEAGVDDPNDVLSDAALTAHGLSALSGGGGISDPSLITEDFTMFWGGKTQNRMNGIQGVVDAMILQRGRFELDGGLRTGIFLNRIQGSVAERYSQG